MAVGSLGAKPEFYAAAAANANRSDRQKARRNDADRPAVMRDFMFRLLTYGRESA